VRVERAGKKYRSVAAGLDLFPVAIASGDFIHAGHAGCSSDASGDGCKAPSVAITEIYFEEFTYSTKVTSSYQPPFHTT